MLDRDIHVTHSLVITYGVTPADLLAANMTAIEQALIGLETGVYYTTAHSVRPCRQTLYRLSYARIA